MMPSRWWAARRPRPKRARARPVDLLATTVTARPPAADSSVIHQESLRLWTWVAVGVVLAGAGVALLAVSAVWGQDRWTTGVAVAAGIVAITVLTVAWWSRAAPSLGSED